MEPIISSSSQPLNRKLQQQKVTLNAVGFDRKSKSSRENVELHCLLGAWFLERTGWEPQNRFERRGFDASPYQAARRYICTSQILWKPDRPESQNEYTYSVFC